MTLVVDASVALKWVIDEPGADRARALLANESLVAPELFWAECANVLWTKARRRQIIAADARAAFAAIDAAPVSVIASRSLALAAQTLAFDLDQTVYDCLYLAAALAERTVLVTADEVFAAAVAAHPVYAANVRVL